MASDEDAVNAEVPAVPDKRDWPRTEYGTIDWEAAFEAPDVGLIPHVEQSQTANGILACSKVIIHSLFNRKDDADARLDYERKLNDAMIVNMDARGEAVEDAARRDAVITLLRDIKAERIERAEFHIARIKAGVEESQHRREADAAEDDATPDVVTHDDAAPDDDAALAAPPDDEAPAAEDAAMPDVDDTPETEETPEDDIEFTAQEAFVEALSRLMAQRLETLRADVKPGPICRVAPPYPVSPEFAERFDKLIREQFAPAMMGACRPFIMQAEHQDPAARVDYILKNMEERRSREILWGSWQVVWRELTEEQELPKKPKEEKKNLLGRLKKKKAQPAWKGEQMTVEEWEATVKRIERDNKRAQNIWNRLTEPHRRFLPPDDGDRKTLMNLFARTPGALSKQISPIRQIAEQSGNQGKIFSEYQQGKDIDLPLVCACCQRPGLMLEKGVLKDFMRGFPDGMRRDRFRMTSRFFSDYI